MKLEEYQVYQLSMKMAEEIFGRVVKWDYFSKDTIGKQLMRSVDSVAANLSEGFGRFYYKEEKQFCYYSRGSLYETKTWLTKAFNRNLIDAGEYEIFSRQITNIGVKLNNYINSIGKRKPSQRKSQQND
ncbi:MAG TPA: four helix bundle protein [Balneolales bacterium]|nr:four helix bundle protein [Balneolales bacterium]